MRLIAASGVVARRPKDGRLLLVRRRDEQAWGIPGGHVEPGETWLDSARREFREETGWTVRIHGLFGIYSNPATQRHRYPSGIEVHFVGVVFEGILQTHVGNRDHEASELGFFPLEELPEPLWEPDREVLDDLRSEEARPFIR